MKLLFTTFIFIFTLSAHANQFCDEYIQELIAEEYSDGQCATNLAQLKSLTAGFNTANWNNKGKGLTLRFENAANQIRMIINDKKGLLATVTVSVCESGSSFKAKVSNLTWGPSASDFVKGIDKKEFKMKFEDSKMSLSLNAFMSLSFSPQ